MQVQDDEAAAESEDDDAESSTVSATTVSESDGDDSTSDTTADSDDSDSDSDSDEEDEEDEKLEKLLKAARIAATKPAAATSTAQNVDAIAGGDEVVSFGQDEAEQRRRKEASVLSLPSHHYTEYIS